MRWINKKGEKHAKNLHILQELDNKEQQLWLSVHRMRKNSQKGSIRGEANLP